MCEFKLQEAAIRMKIKRNKISANRVTGFAIVLIMLLLVSISITVKAGTFEVNYGLSTNHATSYYKYQEDNDLWVASYRFDDSKWGVLGATFQNSYYVDST
ncbi:MAG: hypothetical protein V3R25_06165, partial [Nitrosomonadaceae bacterium]